MPDKKISALTAASALTGTEVFPLVQSGATKKATINQIIDLVETNVDLQEVITNGNDFTGIMVHVSSTTTTALSVVDDAMQVGAGNVEDLDAASRIAASSYQTALANNEAIQVDYATNGTQTVSTEHKVSSGVATLIVTSNYASFAGVKYAANYTANFTTRSLVDQGYVLGLKLSAFAATTSAELASVISDETGSGSLVFANTPTLITPVLGVATATSINFGQDALNYYDEGTYTPTWACSASTQPAIGNGTISGYYTRIGRQVSGYIDLQFGTTTTTGSANPYTFTLPFTSSKSIGAVGASYALRSGSAFYAGTTVLNGATTISIVSNAGANFWHSTIPATWAQPNDYFRIYFNYFV